MSAIHTIHLVIYVSNLILRTFSLGLVLGLVLGLAPSSDCLVQRCTLYGNARHNPLYDTKTMFCLLVHVTLRRLVIRFRRYTQVSLLQAHN